MTTPPSPKHQAERQIFGFAITQDTTEVLRTVKRRDETRNDPDHLGYTTSSVIEQRITGMHQFESITDDELSDTLILLAAGVRDSYSLLRNVYDANPQLGFEQAAAITRHDKTARLIAAIALREQEDVWTFTSDHHPDKYQLDPSGLFVQQGDALTIPKAGGCPFAGHEDVVKPDPLFTRFIHWAGELSVQYYFDTELKK